MDKKHLRKLQNAQIEILDEFVGFCNRNNLEYFLIGGTLLGSIRHDGFIPWDDDLDVAMPRKDYEIFKETFKDHGKFILDSYETNSMYWLPFLKIRNKNTVYLEKIQKNYNGPTGIWMDIFPLDYSNTNSGIWHKIRFKTPYIVCGAICKKSRIEHDKSSICREIVKKALSIMPKRMLVRIQETIMQSCKDTASKYYINLGSKYGSNKQTHLRDRYYPIAKHLFCGKKYNVPNDFDYVLKKIYGEKYMELPPKEKRVTHNPLMIIFEDGEKLRFNENDKK